MGQHVTRIRVPDTARSSPAKPCIPQTPWRSPEPAVSAQVFCALLLAGLTCAPIVSAGSTAILSSCYAIFDRSMQ